jgi:S-adenosylmethionine:tRNA ribosyltransferase-isomerase
MSKSKMNYRLADFDYDLPQELIADYPLAKRSASRLLYLNGSAMQHDYFYNLTKFLQPGDLLVFNDTKVMPARLYGKKQTGGAVEILIERVLEDNTQALCHIKSNRKLHVGQIIYLDHIAINIIKRHDGLFHIQASHNLYDLMQEYGTMPLPPYIQREAEKSDSQRYQTIYNKHIGAVAAPTAGLHFDDDLMHKLQTYGVHTAFITLHVGAGTFKPVKVTDIREHQMHAEYFTICAQAADKINQAKQAGRRVIAVGTTSLRALESVSVNGICKPYNGQTQIFIYPGYKFNIIDCLITNFHLPKSTLLMLVSAFAGFENIMRAYSEAIAQRYRFFSYGDAMLLGR